MATTKAKKPAKKKKKGHGRLVLTILMVVLIFVASTFIYYLGRTLYVGYFGGEEDQTQIDVDPIVYDTTPVKQSDKVGYYVLGLMGEEGVESPTELISMVCFDKKAKTLRILQLPAATYLGDDENFKVPTVAEVFSNPQDIDWCNICRTQVYAPEKTAENTHEKCGNALAKKVGSSTVNLAQVFNKQYSLPVDGYFIFEQQTFVKLVDLIGGVDVDLAFDVQMKDVTYKKGVRTIDGAAALKYIMATKAGVGADIDRMTRFQQVCTAVLQRLFTMSEQKLTADVFQPLMLGSTPIRVAVGHKYGDIVALVQEISQVKFADMRAYVIPGGEAKYQGNTYFSVNKAELLSLLNSQFNPHGEPLLESELAVNELSGAAKSDLHETVLSAWVVEQQGYSTTTNAEASTTTTNS